MEKGPEKWSLETIKLKRYFVTDALDDFIGSSREDEDLFIANSLQKSSMNLYCEQTDIGLVIQSGLYAP